jgi:hexokinase
MEIFKHVNMSFLKNVRIRGQTPLSAFIVEIIKAIVKKKRTLTFYTLHTLFV